MSSDRVPVLPKTHNLATVLLQLREQTVMIDADAKRIMGIIDSIYRAENTYELQHRLKSLLGREQLFTRMLRRWLALLEPVDTISRQIGPDNA